MFLIDSKSHYAFKVDVGLTSAIFTSQSVWIWIQLGFQILYFYSL